MALCELIKSSACTDLVAMAMFGRAFARVSAASSFWSGGRSVGMANRDLMGFEENNFDSDRVAHLLFPLSTFQCLIFGDPGTYRFVDSQLSRQAPHETPLLHLEGRLNRMIKSRNPELRHSYLVHLGST